MILGVIISLIMTAVSAAILGYRVGKMIAIGERLDNQLKAYNQGFNNGYQAMLQDERYLFALDNAMDKELAPLTTPDKEVRDLKLD